MLEAKVQQMRDARRGTGQACAAGEAVKKSPPLRKSRKSKKAAQ